MAESDIKGRALDVAGLVEYQQGSVVSREFVKGEAGTVTVFAFDEGEGLSEHTAPYDATVFILDGRAQITISGIPHTAETGQAVIMPAGEPHSLKANERFKMLLIMIRK